MNVPVWTMEAFAVGGSLVSSVLLSLSLALNRQTKARWRYYEALEAALRRAVERGDDEGARRICERAGWENPFEEEAP